MTRDSRRTGFSAAMRQHEQKHDDSALRSRITRISDPLLDSVSYLRARKSPIEKTRDEGFVAVRLAGGKYLARPLKSNMVALDSYMMESGQYSAIAHNWVKLKSLVPEIKNARSLLDVTSGTGILDIFVLNGSDTQPTVFANEISPELIELSNARFRTLAASIDPKDGTIIPVSLDLSSPSLLTDTAAIIAKASMDVVLWWGSFNMSASRGRIMSNSFDILRPGGRLVIMDVYPWEPIPFSYVGAKGSTTLALLSRSLDMAEDVKRWVTDQWTKKVSAAIGHDAASSVRIEIMELAESLSGLYVENQSKREMRCLCFKKPDISDVR